MKFDATEPTGNLRPAVWHSSSTGVDPTAMPDARAKLDALWDRLIAEVLGHGELCDANFDDAVIQYACDCDVMERAAKVREALLAKADDITEVTKWVGNGDDPWSETRRVIRVGWAVPDA